MKSILLAAALLLFPGIVHADEQAPLVLPDSDTSSLGVQIPVGESPFNVICADAKEFNARLHRVNASGLMVGTNTSDHTLLMVYKSENGLLIFARSDYEGKHVCIYGMSSDTEIQMGTLLKQPKEASKGGE